MRGFAIAVVLVPLSVLASSPPAVAYTGGPVADGGAITGTVTYAGSKPKAAPLKVSKDHGTCGHTKPSEALLVGPARGLANTVVYLEKIAAGKPAPTQLVYLSQKGCVYEPHVQAAVRRSKIELRSSNSILHNVHGRSMRAARSRNSCVSVRAFAQALRPGGPLCRVSCRITAPERRRAGPAPCRGRPRLRPWCAQPRSASTS